MIFDIIDCNSYLRAIFHFRLVACPAKSHVINSWLFVAAAAAAVTDIVENDSSECNYDCLYSFFVLYLLTRVKNE